MADQIVLTLPMRLVSTLNQREHWSKKAKRHREQRSLVAMAVRPRLMMALPLLHAARTSGVVVTITRIGKRKLDGDNLQGSAKAVRDSIADALEIDDGDDRITWRYEQEIGKAFAVRISIAKGAA